MGFQPKKLIKVQVLITGAYGGLGAVLSENFINADYDLILLGRDLSKLKNLKKKLILKKNQKCYLEVCDLSDAVSVEHFTKNRLIKYKNLEVLINNAAIHGFIGPFYKQDMNELKKAFEVNFFSPVLLCKAGSSIMKKNKKGSIINLSGGGATSPRPMFSCYGASKTALVRFSETIAKELEEFGINVNCISPGIMPTNLLKEVLDKGIEITGEKEFKIAKENIDKNFIDMNRVAKLALYLSSNIGRKISGKLISALWDDWENWSNNVDELSTSDVFTLRRILKDEDGNDT